MVKQFFGCISFRIDFFASFFLISVRFRFRFFLSQAIFRFIFVSLQFFRLFHGRFRFRFLLFRFDVKQAKSCLFSLPSETKYSLQFHFSLPKRKRGRTLVWILHDAKMYENVRKLHYIFFFFTFVL